MIRDGGTTYSLNQAITTLGNTDSTNIYDQLAPGDTYEALFLDVQVTQTFTSGGAGTLQVNLITDSSPAFATAPVTYTLTPVLALSSLTAGAVLVKQALPLGLKRYRKLQYVVGTAAMTAGQVTAFEAVDVQTNRNQ